MSSLHLKIEQPQAIAIRKSVLLMEKDFLECAKHIKNYSSMRKQEFILKSKLKRDFQVLNNLIDSMENNLPKEEVELILKEAKTPAQIAISSV